MIQLKHILTEQKSDYLQPYQSDNPANTGKAAANLTPDDLRRGAEKAAEGLKELDTHTVLTILQFITPFIPVVGWFAAAGIGLANAAMYAGEGDTKQAGIETIFALLPGVGKIVQKIPAIGKLGASGMAKLGRKLATSKSPMLNKFELHLIKNLASPKYKDLIKADLTEYLKARAKNEAAQIAKNATKSKAAKIASKSLNKLAAGGITLGKVGAETAADIGLTNTAVSGWDKIYNATGLDAQPGGKVVLDPEVANYIKDPRSYKNEYDELMK